MHRVGGALLVCLVLHGLAGCGDSGASADVGLADGDEADTAGGDVGGGPADGTAGDSGTSPGTGDAAGADGGSDAGDPGTALDAAPGDAAQAGDGSGADAGASLDVELPEAGPLDAGLGDGTGDLGPGAADAGGAEDSAGLEILGPQCGDGTLDEGEECDDGAANSDSQPDACRTDCVAAHCGDGVADTDETCDDGDLDESDACTSACLIGPDLPKPQPGDIIFTELMPNPLVVGDPAGEWFEVHNLTDLDLSVTGCVVRDEGTDLIELAPPPAIVTIAAHATVLFAHAWGPSVEDGGLAADFPYVTMLLDNLADELILECETGVIDALAYDATTFPFDNGAAMALDPSGLGADANDSPSAWCEAVDVYGPGAPAGVGDHGTPGVANPACPPPDVTVDACSLLPPFAYELLDSESLGVTLVYLESDVTDVSNAVDVPAGLLVDFGFGPDGVTPDAESWAWWPGSPAVGWLNPGGLDSWTGLVTISGVGAFDVAARISLDGGATWTYCDGGSNPNDGYVPGDSIHVNALPHPCSMVACDQPPEPGCAPDQVTYAAPLLSQGECALDPQGLPVCDYGVAATDCGVMGQVCGDGGCQGSAAAVTEVGSVFVSEIMILPKLSVIPTGQWVELHNATAEPLDLQGCKIVSGTASVLIDVPLVIGPNAHRVLGSTTVMAANGGATVHFEWGNQLEWSAAAGAVTLLCGEVVIDTVIWTAGGWPIVAGKSLSLSPFAFGAGANDDPGSWCGAPEPFGAGDAGSPAALNDPCPGDVNPIEFCVMPSPGYLEWPAGEPLPTSAWIVDEGLTDTTPGVDLAEGLLVDVGYGPPGTYPGVDAGWAFAPATPAPAWDAAGAGAPDGSDGWVGSLAAPAPGLWIAAFRVSGDGGNTWTYCDLEPSDSGPFHPEHAMQIESQPGPCWPPACDQVPTTACDVNVVVERQGSPWCVGVQGAPLCTWPELMELQDCGAAGGTCEAGTCTGFPGPPSVGQVVISELMIAPPDGEQGEWIELSAAEPDSLTVFDLAGCILESADAELFTIGTGPASPGASTLVFPTDQLVLARSSAVGQGFLVYGDEITLGNTSDFVRLSCGDELIDEVAWDPAAGWVVPSGRPLQLGGNQVDATDNDAPGAWCAAAKEYGTPGQPNPLCPPLDGTVDGCILTAPEGLFVDPGEVFTAIGRIFDAGVTDVSPGTDTAPGIVVSFGAGPEGTHPSSAGWTWSPGFADSFWDDIDAPGEDQWRTPIALEDTGAYAVAMRASADGGATWRLCDRDGAGAWYSASAYEIGQSGSVSVGAPACVPNPCDVPPEATCEGNTLWYPSAEVGVCLVGAAEEPVCDYPIGAFDCSHFGGCVGGSCALAPQPPTAPGQLVITEVLRDSSQAPPDQGEWFELFNPGGQPLDLRGCTVSDLGGDLFTVTGTVPVVAPAGDYLVLGITKDALVNGGTPVDLSWGLSFTLDNIFDEITLSCGGIVIDDVAYGLGWPGTEGVAMQLSPGTIDATANDDPSAWCAALSPFGSNGDLGTPGQLNKACPK